MPKNKLKPKFNIPSILSILLLLVFALELAGIYFYWYKNLEAEKVEASKENIVRVDLAGYRSTIQLLDNLSVFQPESLVEPPANPFIYR